MAAEDSPATLVARFLRTNNYVESLDAFLSEANLPPDTGANASAEALTIEKVLQEKKVYDVSQRFEKVAVDDGNKGWRLPAPSVPSRIDTLPAAANILNVSVESFATRSNGATVQDYLLVSTAARGFHALSVTEPHSLTELELPAGDSPTLAWTVVRGRYLLATSMSGRLALYDLLQQRLLGERKDHSKYVVRITAFADDTGVWVATAAWDARVLLYRLALEGDRLGELGSPVGEVKLQTNPEAILLIRHPELADPVLLLSRRDSTFLYYHALPSPADPPSPPSHLAQLPLLGRQNLAPHSNAWIAFTPSAVAPHPTDPNVVAIATSHTPYMKLIVARLLLPPPDGDPHATAPPPTAQPATSQLDADRAVAAGEARRLLAVQGREDAAIASQTSTRAPQTGFSTPAAAWRADGTGVFVNGDDGAVRGVEAGTGRVVATLAGGAGHEPGSKVRCLWAGVVGGEEVVFSGGFDRRLVVWRCAAP